VDPSDSGRTRGGRPRLLNMVRHNGLVDISARTEYALRAMLQLATAPTGDAVSIDALASAQDLPRRFLEAIFSDLKSGGLVRSVRGPRGGYVLTREPEQIPLGDVMRAVSGPLAEVRGLRPHETKYNGVAAHLPEVWVAVRVALRDVLDATTLADVLTGKLPANVKAMADRPEAWQNR
jgi:Rrf2 family protein